MMRIRSWEHQGGENKICKIAKIRDENTKKFTHIKQIRKENRKGMTDESKIKKQWKKYFEHLLNKENPRVVVADKIPTQTIK